ncbi:MAG: hypothetical protein KBS53_01100 [Bacteroidales bacterium]|nr:hypothetical protein [Candidatus Hennigimonas equi]
MHKYIIAFCFACLAVSVQLGAQTKDVTSEFSRHEVRLGVGDMLFETMIWHNHVHKSYVGSPAGILYPEKRGYGFLPHISGEYAYHILPWMSIGGTIDFQQTYWRTEYFSSADDRVKESVKENFYNLCIMPTVRFNYFRREHVGLYSALAVGMDINGGTEKNGRGQKTVVGAALDLRPIGVIFGADHYWGYVELGCLNALKSKDEMFLLCSEIVRVGLSYKF